MGFRVWSLDVRVTLSSRTPSCLSIAPARAFVALRVCVREGECVRERGRERESERASERDWV